MFERWLQDNLRPGAKVLDIGCGDGTFSEALPQYNWTGIDINTEVTKFNGQRLTFDLEKTPYDLEEASFDAVICSEVLEHLWAPEKIHAEANRLLKPNGLYAISTPNFDWVEHHFGSFRQVMYNLQEGHTREHIRFYNLDSHVNMLASAGFRAKDYMGADLQFGSFFRAARVLLSKGLCKNQSIGEIDYTLGRMFPTICHTIGVLGVKK